MKIQIDGLHLVSSQAARWFLQGRSGLIRSKALTVPREAVDAGGLFRLSATLAHYGLIPVGSPDAGSTAQARAAEIEQELKSTRAASFTFGGGRFAVERGEGDWVLLNPSKDVQRLRDQRGPDRAVIVVGYFPSIRSALAAAVERTLQADSRTIDYAGLDAAIDAASSHLWADALPRDPHAPERLPAVLWRAVEGTASTTPAEQQR